MSRELLIMRHAKSDWGDASLRDFDRPLNKRGLASAPKMGRWLHEQGLVPDAVISSPAERARQTASRTCAELGIAVAQIKWDKRIYDAVLSDLLDVLADSPAPATRVLLVGHNPGLEHLLMHLCSTLPRSPDGKLLPTATIAHVRLPDDWTTLDPVCGELLMLQRPRDLPN